MRAAGREVRRRDGDACVPMESFAPMRGANDIEELRHWHGGLVVGTSEAVAQMCQQ